MMPDRLEILQLGNPLLRQPAAPVVDFSDAALSSLLDSLLAIATAANGVGLAAPQVAWPFRLFIIASRPTPRYPQAPLMAPTAMFNPQILDHSAEIVKDWEGCLSVPGIRGLVPRYRTISVEYWDQHGEHQHQQLTDFPARIFQHELDHLNGIVFLDRVESTRDLATEQEYQRLISSNADTESQTAVTSP